MWLARRHDEGGGVRVRHWRHKNRSGLDDPGRDVPMEAFETGLKALLIFKFSCLE
jgi:hypothetical protein